MLLPVGAVAAYRSPSENRPPAAAVNPLRPLRIPTMSVGLPKLAEAVLLDNEGFALPAEPDETCPEGW